MPANGSVDSAYPDVPQVVSNPFAEWASCLPAALEFAHSAITNLIPEANQLGVMDNDMKEFLYVKFPIVLVFYALPKINKGISPPPGRPIVSSIGSSMSQASQLVDDYLIPHVYSLPYYLKDTTQLLQIVNGITVLMMPFLSPLT